MLHSSELVRPFQVVNSHRKTGRENSEKTTHRATPLNSEEPASQTSIAALPLLTYQVGETVIAYGSRTARLLILKKGAVAAISPAKIAASLRSTRSSTIRCPGRNHRSVKGISVGNNVRFGVR